MKCIFSLFLMVHGFYDSDLDLRVNTSRQLTRRHTIVRHSCYIINFKTYYIFCCHDNYGDSLLLHFLLCSI